MSTPIISVEKLGKQYRLNHQFERHRYVALRDVIAEGAKRAFNFRRRGNFGQRASAPSRSENFWALKDVSFEIQAGEVVGIIGRNGAGKSTVLKILSRITDPSAGRVRLRGRVGSLLEVGTGFHPELTGRENIYLNGAILGMKKTEIRRKFDEIVAFAEVEKFLDTPVKRYSSGMYVRLAFAVAAHLEPEILIVDEVLAVGDAEFQKKCLGKMEDVAREHGRTVLFVSHNMAAVQALCGNGLLLERGQLLRVGPIESVVNEYGANMRASHVDSGAGPVPLGPTLALNRLNVRPQSIKSAGALSLDIELAAQETTSIRELALLIYSNYGVRVAVLDLRTQGICNFTLSDRPVELKVRIPSVPLVEGDYNLGLYLGTNHSCGNYPDLATFTIRASTPRHGVTPYAAEYRGFLSLDFSAERKSVEEMETCSA
jgi:homopolymeric O-antigen transport system ATP-binding protein